MFFDACSMSVNKATHFEANSGTLSAFNWATEYSFALFCFVMPWQGSSMSNEEVRFVA